MGEVYRARDTRLGRIVAIKLISVKTRRTLKLAFCSSAKRARSPPGTIPASAAFTTSGVTGRTTSW